MGLIQCHQVDADNIYLYTRERRKLAARQVAVAPPDIPAGHVAKWETPLHPFSDVAWSTDGTWVVQADHRKDDLYIPTGKKYELGSEFEGNTYNGIGELPVWLTNEPPTSEFSTLIDGVWVIDVAAELAAAKSILVRELSAACEAEIYAGFESNALGSVHHYPAGDKDQQNLTASVLDSIVPDLPEGWLTPFWCEIGGVWEFRMHTATEIQQVGRDGKARILACMAQNDFLASQVHSAASITELSAIEWVSPA